MKNGFVNKWIPLISAILLVMIGLAFWESDRFCPSVWADTEPTAPASGEAVVTKMALGAANDHDFVRVRDHLPEIEVALQYAGTNNITGQTVYDFQEAYLRYGTVQKLAAAQEKLARQGYGLRIWDAFRPVEAQFALWEAMPDSRYIANPHRGYSDHSRGNCVDITLIDADGREAVMPTGFDDFTSRADRDYSDVSEEAAANALMLESAMTAAGFVPYEAEWWHYTDRDDYGVEEVFDPAETTDGVDTITISAIGDCILATGYGFAYDNSLAYYVQELNCGWDYFFAKVYDVLSQDDLTIANAESVFTTGAERMDKAHQGDEAYWFKSAPAYAQIYSAGSVEAVNVANNHSHDYGEEGYRDTLQALSEAGVAAFGYGSINYYAVKGYTVALLGYNVLGPLEYGVDLTELKQDIARDLAAAGQKAEVVVVSFHWGDERSGQANAQQVELAHYAADLGADLILGHHPHVLQPVEQYNESIIAYSLGNFVYGGARRPQKETMILQVTFTLDAHKREIRQIAYNEIPAAVYGDTAVNNYQPILTEGA